MTDFENKKPSKIIGIQFSILSPYEIQKGSVVEITNKVTTKRTIFCQKINQFKSLDRWKLGHLSISNFFGDLPDSR